MNPITISMILLTIGIVSGTLGSLLAFHIDRKNKFPHLAPLRYLGAAVLMGFALNAIVWAYSYFIIT